MYEKMFHVALYTLTLYLTLCVSFYVQPVKHLLFVMSIMETSGKTLCTICGRPDVHKDTLLLKAYRSLLQTKI
jgi:hypothetical protein